jgi:hypothetical protein
MQPDSHAAQQQAFEAALWQQDLPAGLRAPVMAEVAQRFAVYRNNVQHSLTRALAARFAVVEQLVGPTFFTAMARVHIAQDPPQSPVLLGWGATFADFLDGFAPVAHLPFLGDVARLEYARGRAYHAADAAPVAADALAVAEPATLRLGLHPSVQLFTSPHPALQIWQAHQTGATRRPLLAGPDHALIGRAPDFSIVTAPLDQDTYAVLRALAAGDRLGDATTHADPTAALTLLLRHGLITTIDTGVSP